MAKRSDDHTEPETRVLDPNAMSAADQAEVQRLHSARDAAETAGDTQAVADIDEQLKTLLG